MSEQVNGSAAPDPIFDAYVARVDAALERDGADPATTLSEIEGALAELNSALGPRRKAKRLEKANKALDAAREALRRKAPDALRLMREALAAQRKAHGLPPKKEPRRRFGLAAMLEHLPPPKTVCKRLEWDVGRPPMMIGAPGGAKTYAIQQAALDLAMGRSLWGCPDFRPPGPVRVLHVDLDQGRRKTLRRYQRLLRGAGVDAHDEGEVRRQLATIAGLETWELGTWDVDEGDGLVLGSLQPEELQRWRAAWVDAARGYDVVFVDSLRRLAPFLDENDSRFSTVPDALRWASEEADVVILLIHHASNKSSKVPGAKAPPGTRGSSAIDGAAGTQLAIERDKEHRKVTQIRAGEAAELSPFYLAFENDDEAGPNGIRGVRIRYRSVEEAKAPEKAAKSAKMRSVMDRALAWIRECNLRRGYGPLRKNVVATVEGNDRQLYAALDQLVQEKLVRVEMEKRLERLWASDVSPKAPPAAPAKA